MLQHCAGALAPLVSVLTILFAGFGAAAEEARPARFDSKAVAEIVDPMMAGWIDDQKGAGAVVVVVSRDGPIFAKGYGYADVAGKTPFTADATLVRPGSISKLFTGVAVMQLVEQGRLDLDRNVQDYVDFAISNPPGGVPVTLRRLLTHRAGFEEHAKGLFSRGPPQPLGDWLPKSLPPRLFPNGDVPAYSNHGFALAGYVVERVSEEPFADYVARHILGPLGMSRSTFQQPLPAELAPMMAKGYRASDQPPLPFFETIVAPAGALSATGEDVGRFMRALLNGGALDGVRILSRERLDEMMRPAHQSPAGYLGLAFFGTKLAGHDAVGHGGGTMTFFSDLELFREHGIGVFVSRDGLGGPGNAPNPANAIAQRLLPEAPQAARLTGSAPPLDAHMAGVYHPSRRAESSFLRLADLLSETVLEFVENGDGRAHLAAWPFGERVTLRRIDEYLYESPRTGWMAFVGDEPSPYFALAAMRLQRVPWFLNALWITPALGASVAVVFATLLAWVAAGLWRWWRKRPLGLDGGDRGHLLTRLVLLVDAAAILAVAILFDYGRDFTLLNEALDPALLAIYALAWTGVFGAVAVLWTALRFWRSGAGGRWARLHYAAMAASALTIAWFLVTFRIAGTTLNY